MRQFYGYRTTRMWWKIFWHASDNKAILVFISIFMATYIYYFDELPITSLAVPVIITGIVTTLIIDTFKRWKTLPKKS